MRTRTKLASRLAADRRRCARRGAHERHASAGSHPPQMPGLLLPPTERSQALRGGELSALAVPGWPGSGRAPQFQKSRYGSKFSAGRGLLRGPTPCPSTSMAGAHDEPVRRPARL